MTTTIQKVLYPLYITCFIMGLGIYPVKQTKSRTRWIAHLSTLYSLIVWFVYSYVFYYTVIFFTPQKIFYSVTGIIVMQFNTLITITSAIGSLYYRKKFGVYMKKLAIVDDTLEELGTPKMYRKLHMLSKGIIIGWIVHSLTINFYDTIWFSRLVQTVSWGFLLPHIINHSIHINAFLDLIFIFFLWYIGTRFDKVNEHMRCLLIKEEHELRSWEKPVIVHQYSLRTDNYKRILWTSMHLHLELCRIARELNTMFGMQLTLEITSYLLYLTVLCYYLCLMLSKRSYYKDKKISVYTIIGVGSWFLTCLIRLYVINYMCENVMIKANKIDKIIHHLTNILRYTDLWTEIYHFTLQVMQHPLKFTGLRLFHFGNKLLQKFFMTIVTYVIIMVQLNVP